MARVEDGRVILDLRTVDPDRGRGSPGRSRGLGGLASAGDRRRRHGRPHRPRQDDAAPRADRHRRRPPARGAPARDDHRRRLRAPRRCPTARSSTSSTSPATTGWSATCSSVPARSTRPCSSWRPMTARAPRPTSTSTCSTRWHAHGLVAITKADRSAASGPARCATTSPHCSPPRRSPARRSSPCPAPPARGSRRCEPGSSATPRPGTADPGWVAPIRPAVRLAIDRAFRSRAAARSSPGRSAAGRWPAATPPARAGRRRASGSARCRSTARRSSESRAAAAPRSTSPATRSADLHRGVVLTNDPDVHPSDRLLVMLAAAVPDRARFRVPPRNGRRGGGCWPGRSRRTRAPGRRRSRACSASTTPIAAALRRPVRPPAGGHVRAGRARRRRPRSAARSRRLAAAADPRTRGGPCRGRARRRCRSCPGGTSRAPRHRHDERAVAPDVREAASAAALEAVRAYHAARPGDPVRPWRPSGLQRPRALRRHAPSSAADAAERAAVLVDRAGVRRTPRPGRRPGPRARPPGGRGRSGGRRARWNGWSPPWLSPAPAAAARCRRRRRLPTCGDPRARAQRSDRRPRGGPRLRDARPTATLAAKALALAAREPLTPAAFRDATGTSRSYVLAILEDLDRRGILRRTPAGPRAGSAGTRGRPRRNVTAAALPSASGIVLAGGRSARFGRDKLAESIDGRPLLHLAAEAVATVATDVIIVAPPDVVPPLPDGVRLVHDEAAFEGPLAGCTTGLIAAREPLVLVVGGDMPALSGPVLGRWSARSSRPTRPRCGPRASRSRLGRCRWPCAAGRDRRRRSAVRRGANAASGRCSTRLSARGPPRGGVAGRSTRTATRSATSTPSLRGLAAALATVPDTRRPPPEGAEVVVYRREEARPEEVSSRTGSSKRREGRVRSAKPSVRRSSGARWPRSIAGVLASGPARPSDAGGPRPGATGGGSST